MTSTSVDMTNVHRSPLVFRKRCRPRSNALILHAFRMQADKDLRNLALFNSNLKRSTAPITTCTGKRTREHHQCKGKRECSSDSHTEHTTKGLHKEGTYGTNISGSSKIRARLRCLGRSCTRRPRRHKRFIEPCCDLCWIFMCRVGSRRWG